MLLDVRYRTEGGKTKVELFGKNKKAVFSEIGFSPYLYIRPEKITEKLKEKISGLDEVKKIEKVKRILANEKKEFLKVYVKTPPDTGKVREKLKEEIGHDNFYEYSISFPRKFLIDKKINPGDWIEVKKNKIKKVKNKETKLRKMAIDIETYEEAGENKITMLSLFGKNFKKVLTYKKSEYPDWVEVLENEKELLKRFIKIIEEEDPDIIFGYNSDSFDFKIIDERCEEKDIELKIGREESKVRFVRRARTSSAKIWGRVHIDLFNFISKILSPQLETEVLSLGEVSSEILGDKKIDMELEDVLESWRRGKNLEKLGEYCLKDSELAFRLGEYLLPQILELSRLIGQTPFNITRMAYSQLVEWYLSRVAFENDRIIPSQPKYKEIQKRRKRDPYVGGFVKEPKEGIHEKIVVLDFKSLYPTIMATFNISPETLDCDCCKEEGYDVPDLPYKFCKKKEGFISGVVKNLIKERDKIKKKMKKTKEGSKKWKKLDNQQYALKIIANSTYGYLAYRGSKWYCFECAKSASAFGRYYIKKIIKEAEKDFDVIYGDTDSVFLKSENIKKKSKKFLQKINKELPGIMRLDFDGFYKRGVFVSKKSGKGAKKRYALIDEDKNLNIRGFETVRRDWCSLAKKVQRKVLRLILEKNKPEKATNYVKETIEKIKKKQINLKELIIYEQITKPLEKYEQIGPHVSAAKKMKKMGEPVGPGSIIMFVIREGSGKISDRAEPFEKMKKEKIDSQYYIDHQIIPAALRVLKVLGVTEEELKGKGKQTGLEKFGD